MDYIVLNGPEDVDKIREYREKVADHFGSDKLAEAYMDGLIDWDGNELCDYHGSDPCHCFDWIY